MAEPKTRAQVIEISNRAADAAGIPRLLLLACGIAEGNLKWDARRPSGPAQDAEFWPDVSGGPWQQTVRFDPDYRGGNAYPGPEETARVLELQYDAERSARVAAENLKAKWNGQTDDGSLLRTMYLYNWPGGGGRPYTPDHAENYLRGLAEAKTILGQSGGGPMPTVTYNRDEPAIPQNDSWSCAPTSTRWALKAVGRNPSEAWMESQMKADGVVTEALGLMDASGKQLAQWITAQYGEFGYYANNENPVSFDALAAEFLAPNNPYPGLLGGRAWNHWSGLRAYDPARDVLLLANPDESWKGVGQEMTRAEFAAQGPFSMVRVLHPDLLAAAPAPPAPVPPPTPAPVVTRADLDALLVEHDAWTTAQRRRIEALRDRMTA